MGDERKHSSFQDWYEPVLLKKKDRAGSRVTLDPGTGQATPEHQRVMRKRRS